MKRRTLIRNFVIFSAGAALLPSCTEETAKSSIPLKNISINGDQEKLIESLAETIIPTTDTPGAKELSSSLFVMTMVDECFNKENQEKFTKGLAQFETWSQKKSGTEFVHSSRAQKAVLLNLLEKKNDVPPDILAFYAATKRLTMQSFTSSQYFLTKIQVYEMVPGRFHGCVPVKNINTHG